jgi:hypothetical protein
VLRCAKLQFQGGAGVRQRVGEAKALNPGNVTARGGRHPLTACATVCLQPAHGTSVAWVGRAPDTQGRVLLLGRGAAALAAGSCASAGSGRCRRTCGRIPPAPGGGGTGWGEAVNETASRATGVACAAVRLCLSSSRQYTRACHSAPSHSWLKQTLHSTMPRTPGCAPVMTRSRRNVVTWRCPGRANSADCRTDHGCPHFALHYTHTWSWSLLRRTDARGSAV